MPDIYVTFLGVKHKAKKFSICAAKVSTKLKNLYLIPNFFFKITEIYRHYYFSFTNEEIKGQMD